MGRLQEVLTDIEDGLTAEGWSITVDTLLLHLEERAETFYRFYYARGGSVADLPERFNEENAGLLIDFLEDRGLKAARRIFRRKGWYVDADDLAEWEEFFLSVSLSTLSSHLIDEDDLEIALSGCQDPADGLRFYCECRFGVHGLIDQALSLYRQSGRISAPGVSLLRRHTRERFRRRLIQEDMLFFALQERLREIAIRRGWIRFESAPPDHLKEELALFGFWNVPDEGRLKERYRDLLKKFHPDLNRESEAVLKTQQLNAAYARICAYAEGFASSLKGASPSAAGEDGREWHPPGSQKE